MTDLCCEKKPFYFWKFHKVWMRQQKQKHEKICQREAPFELFQHWLMHKKIVVGAGEKVRLTEGNGKRRGVGIRRMSNEHQH
jgi:hypothetical protein